MSETTSKYRKSLSECQVIGVVGSRSFHDYEMLKKVLDNHPVLIKEIVTGGARGADSLAERYARENGIALRVFPAEWEKYGKQAGYLRNATIVGHSEGIIAFWDGESKGTDHTVKLCRKAGKPSWTFMYKEIYRLRAVDFSGDWKLYE